VGMENNIMRDQCSILSKTKLNSSKQMKKNGHHWNELVGYYTNSYLKNPSFCLVSLPSLCRIFAHSNQTFSLSSLEHFLIGCMKHHGTGAKILLNNIKYQKPSDLW